MSRRRSPFGRQQSLLSRYLLIIVAALLFIPVGIPLTFAGYSLFNLQTVEKPPEEYKLYSNIGALEEQWHQEALELSGQTPAAVDRRLEELSGSYPMASIFWVDGQGRTRMIHTPEDPQLQEQLGIDRIPPQWSAPEAIAFMKEAARQDPLAIVAFVGDRADAGEGFLVMQIPEKITEAYRFQSLGSWYIFMLLAFLPCLWRCPGCSLPESAAPAAASDGDELSGRRGTSRTDRAR